MSKTINVYTNDWVKECVELALSNHLICSGKRSDLQWFGTTLIQALNHQPNSQTSPIYGKLAVNFEDFCYQLCHSTPWGFEMGINWNAVKDVIRGEGLPQHKFFILHDAQYMYFNNFKDFNTLIEIFLEVALEHDEYGQNLKVIVLLEEHEKTSVRKLIRRKEKYPIETLKIIQEGL
ncbi:hypothetical protein [Aureibacter tunicatorum]|uniref:Barstar (Barnase inhibitor) n=1 Tax=Aureibacter tunicatorum TaxID=866807 RepID=A0AAE4BU55_9BACT|nr:hypothetical protein [Aureibacter tunicatorum]MDR6240418.1 hypothetical protein [Aureibacter tunicatorum]BDD05703.1 hypothetical protein AUTU_31860 [Aureibacter tunicatorum]